MIDNGMSIEELFKQIKTDEQLIAKDLAEFGVKPSGQVTVTYALEREVAIEVRQEIIEGQLELVKLKRQGRRVLCEVRDRGVFAGRYVIMSNTHYKRTRKSIEAIRVNQANRLFDQLKSEPFHSFGSNQRKSA